MNPNSDPGSSGPDSGCDAERTKNGEAPPLITDWPGKYTAARYVWICILATLALCIPLQWFAANKNAAAEVTGLIGFIYLLGMVVGLIGRAIYRSKLTTTLRLIKEELPDLEAYAQATNNAKSEAALRQFYWYARWHWCVGLSITGFVTVGLFQLLVV